VKIYVARLFSPSLTRGADRRPSPGATFVKIEGWRQIPTSRRVVTSGLDRAGRHLGADPFAAGVKKLTALGPIRYNIHNKGTRA
jgi:hypothetical protein